MFVERLHRTLAVIVAALLWATSPATGQSQLFLSEPLEVRELDRYAALLQLSPSQRLALDESHRMYRYDVKGLRAGPIAELAATMQAMSDGGPSTPAIREFLRQRESVQQQLALLDRRFFDRLVATLDDDQQASLPRIRLARERSAAKTDQILEQLDAGKQADLLWITLPALADVPSDTRTAADAILQEWERASASDFRAMHETSTSFLREIVKSLRGTRFDDADRAVLDDPDAQAEFSRLLAGAYRSAGKDARRVAYSLRDRTTRSMQQLAAILPPDAAWAVYEGVLQDGYMEVLWNVQAQPSTPYFLQSLRNPSLDESVRVQLEEALPGVWQEERIVLDTLIQRSQTFLKDFDPMAGMFDVEAEVEAGDGEAMMDNVGNAYAFVDTLTTDYSNLGKQGFARLKAITGEHVAEPHSLSDAVSLRSASGPNTDSDLAGRDHELVVDDQMASRHEGTLSRITRREFQRLVDISGASDAVRPVMLDAFDVFRTSFDADSPVEKLQRAERDLWTRKSPSGEFTPPTVSALESYSRLSSETQAAVDALNQGLIETVADELDDDDTRSRFRQAWQQILWKRQADYLSRRSYLMRGDIPSMPTFIETHIGPSYDTLDLIDDYVARTRPILDELRQHFDTVDRRESELHIARRTHGPGTEEDVMAQMEEVRQMNRDASGLRERLLETNTTWLDNAEGRLGSKLILPIRHALLAEAYPQVYNDPIAMTTTLSNVLDLDDLTDSQREAVTELLADYRPAYKRVCDQAVGILRELQRTADATRYGVQSSAGAEAYLKAQDDLKSVSFERRELSLHAASQLRAILQPDQLARAGGLPNPGLSTDISVWH